MGFRVFLLTGLLLAPGWGAAQSVASPPVPPLSVPVLSVPGQTEPASATPAALPAKPADALISALKKSWVQGARGEAVLELVFPPSNTPLRRAQMLPRLAAVPALIRRNFVVTVGPDTVAGRNALRYLLTPNHAQAAHWTIWIDQKWKVMLAYQEQMPDGTLARRAEMISVGPGLARLGVAPGAQPSGLQPSAGQNPLPALKKALLSALPGLKIPAGFEPLSVQLRTGPAGNTATEILLSDGLNVLALVVSPHPVRAASGVAVRRLGGYSVWLVGNLPQSLLEETLATVRRLDTGAVSSLSGTFGVPAASDQ